MNRILVFLGLLLARLLLATIWIAVGFRGVQLYNLDGHIEHFATVIFFWAILIRVLGDYVPRLVGILGSGLAQFGFLAASAIGFAILVYGQFH